ncbi:pde-6 [Pristionchus pacificus]|uniref:Phosphodiesterase n=1 Tax=Pristionchus pacificus TaxID=54126 RepID=A0A2A6BLG5_PRIPA|nr:pde-6 [Pristionchus pacificus]|eukprot:PDM66760.1 pde-6 [Pristionchus pacificus]
MPWCCIGSSTSSTPPISSDALLPLSANQENTQPGLSNHKLQPKTAILVTHGGDGIFIDRLRASNWTVENVSPSSVEAVVTRQKPLVILLDSRIDDLATIAKSIRSIVEDDSLITVISDRSISEKRRRSLAKANIVHFVSWNSRDTSLIEFVARIVARLRILPALYTALDEVEEAIEVCDESHTVAYVNSAYERLTGCVRGHCVYLRRRVSDGFSNHDQHFAPGQMHRDLSLKSIRSQGGGLVDAPISEDAVRLLSSQEIYAPSITRFRDGDRIATQYYDGLIRLQQPGRQRKRSVVDAYRDKRSTSDARRRVSGEVRQALENEHLWSFDVLQLERVSEHHALSQLALKLFGRWKVCEMLQCPEDTMTRWLLSIEAHYHPVNAYHNATHAADVLQATSFFLDAPSVATYVVESHAAASLIAATIHDLDHPGRGNAFLINTRQSLSILYNDLSVLENHHVALAFQLTLQQSNNINILANLPREEFGSMRSCIVEMVLATDIRRHFEYLAKFNQMELTDERESEREAHSITICNMLLKCADISNPAREWALCERWAHRIVQEYFEQTREEKEKALPVTMAFFDRETCNVPLTQVGFVDMFAREAFSCWTQFARLPQVLKQLESNYERWRSMADGWTSAHNNSLHS